MKNNTARGKHSPGTADMTRRQCVSGLGAAAGTLAFGLPAITETAAPAEAAPSSALVPLELRVNGERRA